LHGRGFLDACDRAVIYRSRLPAHVTASGSTLNVSAGGPGDFERIFLFGRGSIMMDRMRRPRKPGYSENGAIARGSAQHLSDAGRAWRGAQVRVTERADFSCPHPTTQPPANTKGARRRPHPHRAPTPAHPPPNQAHPSPGGGGGGGRHGHHGATRPATDTISGAHPPTFCHALSFPPPSRRSRT